MQAPKPFEPHWFQETIHLTYWLGPFRLAAPALKVQTTRAWVPYPLSNVEEVLALANTPPPPDLDGHLLCPHLVVDMLERRRSLGSMICYTPMVYDRRGVDLTLGSDGYWAQFSSKTRFNLKRNIKLFAKACGEQLDWRTYRTADEWLEFHRLALPLSQTTYQHKLFNGGLPDDLAYVEKLRQAAEKETVLAYLLFKDNRPVAYLYFESEGDTLILSNLGHDSDVSKLSPGSVLMALAIEQMQTEAKYRWLDFGSGEGQHKEVYSTGAVHVANVLLLKRTFRNHVITFTHDHVSAFNDWLRTFLKKHDLHTGLKRLVRSWASKGAQD